MPEAQLERSRLCKADCTHWGQSPGVTQYDSERAMAADSRLLINLQDAYELTGMATRESVREGLPGGRCGFSTKLFEVELLMPHFKSRSGCLEA